MRGSKYDLTMALMYVRLALQSASKDQAAAAETVRDVLSQNEDTRARIRLLAVALVTTLEATTPAEAKCHHFSIWNFPWAQRCVVTGNAAAGRDRTPPAAATNRWAVEITQPPNEIGRDPSSAEFSLPSLEGMEFPPDCEADWCQRLKGIGLLRERYGTN